jgi:hypothetical protein
MPNNSFDLFLARTNLQKALDSLRRVSDHPAAHKYERYLLHCPARGENRMTLVSFARTQMDHTFVASIDARGCIGKRRTVLLKDLHLFSLKFILEDHVWVPYDKHWARIEPFYQGEKVVLVGTAVEYSRKNGTSDYTLVLNYVTKLWPPNKTTVTAPSPTTTTMNA